MPVHPSWNPATIYNGIASLRPSEPITGARASYANLLPLSPAMSRRFAFAGALGNGWETRHSAAMVLQNQLRAVNVPFVNQAECRRACPGEITDGMICEDLRESVRDPCLAVVY